ncbi:MAG: hypothetical protein M1129_01320 [Candidatus Thermoplasmatota archaeon]|jgi:hypothetical protein|nr:hypothetical protein [Candidatus Thermoplasmatota archaeon]MCL5955696.1 hypothetical protein [Candidatus Thermoplasmatota archaeon]
MPKKGLRKETLESMLSPGIVGIDDVEKLFGAYTVEIVIATRYNTANRDATKRSLLPDLLRKDQMKKLKMSINVK